MDPFTKCIEAMGFVRSKLVDEHQLCINTKSIMYRVYRTPSYNHLSVSRKQGYMLRIVSPVHDEHHFFAQQTTAKDLDRIIREKLVAFEDLLPLLAKQLRNTKINTLL